MKINSIIDLVKDLDTSRQTKNLNKLLIRILLHLQVEFSPYFSKLRDLLSLVEGVEVVEPERKDECCGFGGMFAVEEDAVSVQMGHDKVMRHIATGAEYIVGADSSCLMHQNGIIARDKLPIKTLHIVEILAAGL